MKPKIFYEDDDMYYIRGASTELDYYGDSYTQRHKRAIDELNGDRPGISPRLRKIVLVTIGVAGLIMLIGKLFG